MAICSYIYAAVEGGPLTFLKQKTQKNERGSDRFTTSHEEITNEGTKKESNRESERQRPYN